MSAETVVFVSMIASLPAAAAVGYAVDHRGWGPGLGVMAFAVTPLATPLVMAGVPWVMNPGPGLDDGRGRLAAVGWTVIWACVVLVALAQ